MDGGDADAKSIPDTCQETTRGPREWLQRRQSQPLQPGKHTGRVPALLHLPCSTLHSQKNPAGQQQPHQQGNIHHLFKPEVC